MELNYLKLIKIKFIVKTTDVNHEKVKKTVLFYSIHKIKFSYCFTKTELLNINFFSRKYPHFHYKTLDRQLVAIV